MYVVIPSTGMVLLSIPKLDMMPGIAEVYDVEYITTVSVLYEIMKMMRPRYQMGQLRGSAGSSSPKSISKFGSVVVATDAWVMWRLSALALDWIGCRMFPLLSWNDRIELRSSSSSVRSDDESECWVSSDEAFEARLRSCLGDCSPVEVLEAPLESISFSVLSTVLPMMT